LLRWSPLFLAALAAPLPGDETEQTQKRPLTRLILTLVTAIFCIGGFGFWIGSEDSSSDNSAADLEREFSRERNRASVAIGGLTAARERENVALTEALESKRIANSKQMELKQALDESEARSGALARELASARENDVAARNLAAARERENAAQALETKQIADARQKELKQALDESEARSEALARELASARENDVAAQNLAAARERENAAQALEAKKITDARQKELKQALDESEARSKALARELASARENDVAARNLAAARERENAARALETKKITDARQRELKQALDESEKRAFVLERELTSARKSIASAEKPSNVEVTAQRGERRNGVARVTPQAAQQGRFAARFAARAQGANFRAGTAALAPRRAWSLGLRAAFVPWHGPVFWPYAYSDIFDYAFWPSGYDDGYFAYAYDDFLDGVFWGQTGPPPEYSYAYAPPNARLARSTTSAAEELCTQPGTGITAWPFAEIKSKVGLNTEQKQLLDQVRRSGQRAASVFKASCPAKNAFAMTPPGRLQAMTLRLTATLEAVQTVRPAMEKFYNSLSDEQKERLNEIGPKQPKNNAEANQTSARDGMSCSEPKAGLANLPIERIEDAVEPTNAQEDGLKHLENAAAKAVSIMQAACPEDTPITPPGRLQAMEKRLQAMIDAANTLKPALNDFYGSLGNEQKARFNIIGGELAQSGN
jgi:LTXXQ motif family protein